MGTLLPVSSFGIARVFALKGPASFTTPADVGAQSFLLSAFDIAGWQGDSKNARRGEPSGLSLRP